MKKIFINNLLIALIFFFLLEIFLKSFGLSDLRGHGSELITKQKNVETVVFGKKVYLNSFGYRSSSTQSKYINKNKKIVFIGDSVLFGSGVNEEQTFVSKLQNKNQEFLYINAGIIGNDLPENIDDIEKNFKLFPGSEFIIIFTLDDVENKTKQESNSKTKKDNNFFNLVKNNFFISRVNHFLRTKSYSYLWIKGLATNPSKRYFEESLQNYKENDNINYFAKKIEEMKIFQKMNSINITFVILPYEYQTRNNCKKNNFTPQKKIKNIFTEKKLVFLDLTSAFCDNKKPKNLYLNFDPVHLSVKGHELVYEYLLYNLN